MTGYGRGSAERDGRRATVEIRSVNHRFLDLKLRGAALDGALEEQLGARVRKQVERGAVTVTVRVEQRDVAGGFRVDLAVARHVHAELTRLATSLGVAPTIELATILAQPGVVISADADADADVDAERVSACVHDAADAALAALSAMRDVEGAALGRDLAARLALLVGVADTVERIAADQPEESRRRLEERLARLLSPGKLEIDPARLAQEVAILADKQDITEELVRLRSHLAQVATILGGDGSIPSRGVGSASAASLLGATPAEREGPRSVGRRLDFLIQELGRELNTIASKSSAAEIVRVIVGAKAELEKIREQVQNVE